VGAVRLAASFLLFSAALCAAADPAADGRKLFLEGITPSGEPLRALVGIGNAPLAGQAVACGNCHGADGRGRPEGAIAPSDIRWEELTKPYGHVRPHRKHRAYSEASFGRAVSEGLDPEGNRLDRAMPRYALSRAELEALLAHLRRLGAERDPGIGAASVRVGTVLPAEPASAQAVRAALEAFVEHLNRAGGIHQRRLELVVAPDATEPVFALLSLRDGFEISLGGSVFSVFSGPAEQAALLVGFAARRATLRPAILAADDRAHLGAAAAEQCAKRGCADVLRIRWRAGELDAAGAVQRLRQARREQIFFFGAQAELAQLLDAVAKAPDAGWQPTVYLSVPASPRAAALSAAVVLAEALRRAGRDLTRERLVRALESLNNYDPQGYGPPVSFGPDRRIGARGAYVVALERGGSLAPASGWISLD
jgi:hypothetical protein